MRTPTDVVRRIKGYLAAGYGVGEVAAAFDMSRQAVSAIRNGRAHPAVRPWPANRLVPLEDVANEIAVKVFQKQLAARSARSAYLELRKGKAKHKIVREGRES